MPFNPNGHQFRNPPWVSARYLGARGRPDLHVSMTHSTAFSVADELSKAFDAPGDFCSIQIHIDPSKETFTLGAQITRMAGGDDAANFAAMRTQLLASAADAACYVLYRNAADEWALFSFVPDTAPVKHKMLYASSKATLLKKLGGTDRIAAEGADWKELDDVALASGTDAERDVVRKQEQQSLMTDIERLRLQADALQAVEAAGAKTTSAAGLTFPLVPDAAAALEQFKSGALAALLLAISNETIVLKGSAASATPAELQPLIPPADACYCLYKWAHERDGAASTALLFLYMCAEEAPVRSKMLHASSKGPFINSLKDAHGLEVAKSIEGVETGELTDAELTTQLYGAVGAGEPAPAITKAAPKGGRKLVKRSKPVDVE